MNQSLRLKLIRSIDLADQRPSDAHADAINTLGAELSGIGTDMLVLAGQTRERFITDLPLTARHIDRMLEFRKRLGEAINAYEASLVVDLPADVERGE